MTAGSVPVAMRGIPVRVEWNMALKHGRGRDSSRSSSGGPRAAAGQRSSSRGRRASQPRYPTRSIRRGGTVPSSSQRRGGPRSSASYGRGHQGGYLDEVRQPRRANPRGFGPWAMRLVVATIAVSVLAVIGAVLYYSNLFPIENVRVEGAEHLTQQEAIQVASVPSDATMLRCDTGAIERRLEQSGWVRSATVTRVLPSTLRIAITEREVAAVVAITSTDDQQDESWIIDADGTWLMELPDQDSEEAASIPAQVYGDAAGVLRITDVPYGSRPVAGAKCTDDAVLNALDIVAGLTTSLADSIVQVSATDAANTTITLENGIEIAFGKAEDIRLKERVCLELMEQHPDEIAYINVRVADRPTWRSI